MMTGVWTIMNLLRSWLQSNQNKINKLIGLYNYFMIEKWAMFKHRMLYYKIKLNDNDNVGPR